MIVSLYEPFRHWSKGGSVYILSDTHFDDQDCKKMDPEWITPMEQIKIINKTVAKGDTFVCLGDVGNPKYVSQIGARKKILILGNHDKRTAYKDLFDEIYSGALFISDKILLSHEPIYGLSWCLNIHGHDHNGSGRYKEGCKHINLATNVCGYTPVSLGRLINDGILADIDGIHREAIDRAVEKKRLQISQEKTDTIYSREAWEGGNANSEIKQLAQCIISLQDEAYYQYLGPVERLCDNPDSTEHDVEWLMDWLIDFCGSPKVLGLYKKICRTFFKKYPKMIADHIMWYRGEYEPETLEEDLEQKDTMRGEYNNEKTGKCTKNMEGFLLRR